MGERGGCAGAEVETSGLWIRLGKKQGCQPPRAVAVDSQARQRTCLWEGARVQSMNHGGGAGGSRGDGRGAGMRRQ